MELVDKRFEMETSLRRGVGETNAQPESIKQEEKYFEKWDSLESVKLIKYKLALI